MENPNLSSRIPKRSIALPPPNNDDSTRRVLSAPLNHHASAQPPSKPNRQSAALKFYVALLYVVVLMVGLFAVYTSQHSQLEIVQRQSATANVQKIAGSDESSTVDTNAYQAVFLTSGQVYFGKIQFMNKDYLKLADVYYLQNGSNNIQSTQSGTAPIPPTSLIKLGCELHAPKDQMVINKSRLDLWENLQDRGRVVQAIKNFVAKNPNGQKCS